MTQAARHSLWLKIISLLAVVRWKNVLITVIAQYLAFLFAFNHYGTLSEALLEYKVHVIIFSTGFILAAGYIINNFYDIERDLINRPQRTHFQNIWSRGFKLNMYLVLNFLGLSFALMASWRIFLYFLAYTVLLWFYSHKLSKMVFIREFSASILSVLVFFSLAIYFKSFPLIFFLYGMSLFFVLFARELHKDIISLKGDLIQGYQSIATTIGIEPSKHLFQVLLFSSTIVDIVFLWLSPKVPFLVIIGLFQIVKVFLEIAIFKQEKWVHRGLQILLLCYIIGIIWL